MSKFDKLNANNLKSERAKLFATRLAAKQELIADIILASDAKNVTKINIYNQLKGDDWDLRAPIILALEQKGFQVETQSRVSDSYINVSWG